MLNQQKNSKIPAHVLLASVISTAFRPQLLIHSSRDGDQARIAIVNTNFLSTGMSTEYDGQRTSPTPVWAEGQLTACGLGCYERNEGEPARWLESLLRLAATQKTRFESTWGGRERADAACVERYKCGRERGRRSGMSGWQWARVPVRVAA